ncbi:MAG: undecaprenyl/decaprenyl-phosphate alpha-N-acetylglucosaminyl 1-phosphate transferase [Synergistaceae bacterium]|jgi:UDP-GlcNAc:undecaprenyl-phosphate GlcNAc-1-phosphate transferase|nr:undecaprenyl/decaprenyl-phosphate alpha-N-acetylglucosaminyl 1-phosphate transferase [Synergistaceae bacterium]
MAIFSAILNFLWGIIATPVSMKLSRTFRLMDVPGGRKKHLAVTPRGAGIVLWTGYLLWALVNPNPGVEVPYVASGATLVFLVGYMDDMHPLPPLKRLTVHILAAAWITLQLEAPLYQKLMLMLWIAGCTSAYNFVDGMDGLALSLAFVTSYLAYRGGNPYTWMPFCGLIAGVLIWNFPHARTFLGDGGATLLGYVCSSHLAWDISPRFFNMGPLPMALILLLVGGVPVIDTLAAMIRRMACGKSPFRPDRGHAHHILLDRKLAAWQVLSLLVLAHASFVGAGYYTLHVYVKSGP